MIDAGKFTFLANSSSKVSSFNKDPTLVQILPRVPFIQEITKLNPLKNWAYHSYMQTIFIMLNKTYKNIIELCEHSFSLFPLILSHG
jgi:hypothetical protein